jgi:predicted Zn-dependent protease
VLGKNLRELQSTSNCMREMTVTIEPPDSHFLSSAIGWLELGNPDEARAELSQVSAELRAHPDVLELEWAICQSEENWEDALRIARVLIKIDPMRSSGWLHQAYALRRVNSGGLEAAWNALLPAADRFPKDSTIWYNLACYACQLQKLDKARLWLSRSFQLGDKRRIKEFALRDTDLESLWREIKKL